MKRAQKARVKKIQRRMARIRVMRFKKSRREASSS
jgi:hypothetical protein